MQNKKGFTLVELLAVVVILGIIMVVAIPAVNRWISRSKGESKAAQEKTLLLAGQAYAQGNSKVLPKVIGETKFIKAIDLKKANYLKDDLIDSDKKDCMKDSVVRIYKYDNSGYSYSAFLYCEGDTVPDEIIGVKPAISVDFIGDHLKDGKVQDVASAGFVITIDGGKKDGKNLGIDGYTYSISVKYDNTGEIVEIFNSGSLNAGGKEKLVIQKGLSDYTNITTVNEFIITVEAYNRDGGYEKVVENSKYEDKTPPKCGAITGQAALNEWFTTPHVSTISVKCIDEENGSGCLKSEFTQSFNTEMNDGVVKIQDNAGNETNCTVRVHLDWTKPTLTVVAYERTSDGGKGEEVARATANNSNTSATLNAYTRSNNGWLNYANYPYGIYYEVIASDNVLLHSGQWYYNNTGIYNTDASNLNTMTTGSSKSFSDLNGSTSVSLQAEGLRRARYEVTDKAGNKVTVHIQANIDITQPTCSTSKSNLGTTAGVTVAMTCSDRGSGFGTCPCSASGGSCIADTGLKASKSYYPIDAAGNQGSCGVTVLTQIQRRNWNTCKTGHNTCVGGYNKVWSNCATGHNTCKSKCLSYQCCTTAGQERCGVYPKAHSGMVCACLNNDPCGEGENTCKGGYVNGSWNNCLTGENTCKGGWDDWFNTGSCSSSSSVECRTLYS